MRKLTPAAGVSMKSLVAVVALAAVLLVAFACGDGGEPAETPGITATPVATEGSAAAPSPTSTAPPAATATPAPTLAEPASAGEGGWTIEDAKQFREFPLYWLGESYEGLPLTKIIRYRYDPEPPIPAIQAENIVLFIYGSCNPGPEGGCPPPLSIRVEPYCMNPPEGFAPAVRGGPFEVRGALAEQVSGDIRIWTGDVSVAIFTDGLAAQVDAGEQLRLVSEGPEGAQRTLGPPTATC